MVPKAALKIWRRLQKEGFSEITLVLAPLERPRSGNRHLGTSKGESLPQQIGLRQDLTLAGKGGLQGRGRARVFRSGRSLVEIHTGSTSTDPPLPVGGIETLAMPCSHPSI